LYSAGVKFDSTPAADAEQCEYRDIAAGMRITALQRAVTVSVQHHVDRVARQQRAQRGRIDQALAPLLLAGTGGWCSSARAATRCRAAVAGYPRDVRAGAQPSRPVSHERGEGTALSRPMKGQRPAHPQQRKQLPPPRAPH